MSVSQTADDIYRNTSYRIPASTGKTKNERSQNQKKSENFKIFSRKSGKCQEFGLSSEN